MKISRIVIAALLLQGLAAQPAAAWPADLSARIAKDALRLVPKSLAEIIVENEAEIFADARTSTMKALPLLYLDLRAGRLSTASREALGKEFSERAKALQGDNFRAAVIALGATYRLAVDLADPAVGIGATDGANAAAIRREFYSFVTANRDKIPLVVTRPDSLQYKLEAMPAFLGDVMAATPEAAALLRSEALEGGRVFRASEIDFRSPVFAVASTAYSRSVSAVAAIWTAIWRNAGGDMTRRKAPQIIAPRTSQNPQERP